MVTMTVCENPACDYDIVIPEEDMEGLVTVADVAAVIEKLAK